MEPTPYDKTDDEPNAPRVPRKLYAARTWTIVLTAVLTPLVLIAAIGNQAVSKRFADYLSDHATTAPDYTVGAFKSLLTFRWRFAPASGQSTHAWASSFAGIGTLLVLTWLLVWIVARGSVTFPRIWVTVAAIVAAVTPIAVMVRNVVIVPQRPGPLQSRLGQSVYGYADFGPVVVAGVALGLIAGLFAALVAVITRRPVELPRIEVPVAAPINAYGVPDPGYEPPAWGSGPILPAYEDAPTQYVPPVVPDAPTISADAPTQYVPAVVPDAPYAPAPDPAVYAPVQAPEAHEPAPQPEPEPAPQPEPVPAPQPPSEAASAGSAAGEVEVGEHDMEIATDEFPAITETLPPVTDR